MKSLILNSLALLISCQIENASAFSPVLSKRLVRSPLHPVGQLYSSLDESAPSDTGMDEEPDSPAVIERRDEIKQQLLSLCASYDRGFGASPRARKEVDELVEKLASRNPTPMNASRGVDGEMTDGDAPLKGNWRMVWTTALDVLNLGANPLLTTGAIYQVIVPPIATNIIDLIPRAQALLPTAFPSTLVRAEVKTRASLRPSNSNRVGLNFEEVKLVPIEVLGMDAKMLPPIGISFPQINLEDLPGVDPSTAPGFFDVIYLDDDMLIIKQNAPGGIFVSIKTDNYDP